MSTIAGVGAGVGFGVRPPSINEFSPLAVYRFSSPWVATATGIASVADSSGNGNAPLVQGTGSAQPAFSATALNGRPCGVFDGTTHFMYDNGGAICGAVQNPDADDKPHSIAIAYQMLTTSKTMYFVGFGYSGGTTPFHYLRQTTGILAYYRRGVGGVGDIAAFTYDTASTAARVLVESKQSTLISAIVNGVAVLTNSACNTGPLAQTLPAGIVDQFGVGCLFRDTPSQHAEMRVGLVAVWDRALTQTEMAQVSAIMQAEFGL